MVQIFVNGPKESGFLELFDNIEFSIETYTNVFDDDFSTGEISLPFEVPWTPHNRRLLGFVEMIENYSNAPEFYLCTVYDDGFPELVNVKFSILEKTGNFNYLTGKFNANISGEKGIFGSKIKNVKLNEIAFDKIVWTGNKDSRQFATDVMKGLFPEYDYISFCPLVIENFIDTSRSDFTNEFLALDTVNNVVINLPNWQFGRLSSGGGNNAVAPGNAEYIDYRTIPFFKVKFIIQQIFKYFGYTIVGDFVNDNVTNNMVLYNNVAIEQYTATFYDNNRSITPQNHMPNLLVIDFLKRFFSFFKLFPSFSNNTVSLNFKNKFIANKKILDITNFVVSDFTSTIETQDFETKKGYTLKYKNDGDDYRNDWVKDLTTKTIVGTVDSYASYIANGFNYYRQLTTDDLIYIENENTYYQIVDATASPATIEAYSEKLNDYKIGIGEKEIDLGMGVFCQHKKEISNLWRTDFEKLATRQPGTYINSKGILVKRNFELFVFYSVPDIFSGIDNPVSQNYDWDGNSLILDVQNGLKKYHSTWENFRIKNQPVKTYIVANKKLLNDIEKHNILQINNVQFLLYYLDKRLPLKGLLEIRLVPL